MIGDILKNFILTESIKKNLIKDIDTFLKSGNKEIANIEEKCTFDHSKNGGRITVSIPEEKYIFVFNMRTNPKRYIIVDTNFNIIDGRIYLDSEMEDFIESQKNKLLNTIIEKINNFCENNKEYKSIKKDSFCIEIKNVNKDEAALNIKFKNDLFDIFSKNFNVFKVDRFLENLSSISFNLNKYKMAEVITDKNEKIYDDFLNIFSDKKYCFSINFNTKEIKTSNQNIFNILNLDIKEKYSLEDIFNIYGIKKISLIKDVLNYFYNNEYEDILAGEFNINLLSVKKDFQNIYFDVRYKERYSEHNINIKTSYAADEKLVDPDAKLVIDNILKNISDKLPVRYKKIDDLVKEEKKTEQKNIEKSLKVKNDDAFKENPLLLRAVLIFINTNVFCSPTSLNQFLKGRKMDSYFKKTEGYGAFSKISLDASEILGILTDFNILKQFAYSKYGNYCSKYKINKKYANILNLFTDISKEAPKESVEYIALKMKSLEKFNEENMDILQELLENEFLLKYFRNDFEKVLKNSSDNIKIYVKTMYEMEENKKIKKILEDILK